MEKTTMSRLLIETTVRQTLKGLQQDPRRSVRNLVDLALQFSRGRFQSRFFATAQTMLEKEDSAYYTLIQDAAAHIDAEHLVRFGMNLGYNSCTWGAQRIRANEASLGFNIPWAVLLSMEGPRCLERLGRYHRVIAEGEGLGIYSWMLFAREMDPLELLPLVKEHPDSAFFLFCPPGTVDRAFAAAVTGQYNLMPVVCLDRRAEEACGLLRQARLPYSVWLSYAAPESEALTDGTVFARAASLHPVFTALLSAPACGAGTRAAVSRAAETARAGQTFATVPWELYTDTCRLDEIISEDACWACFDGRGELCLPGGARRAGAPGLFPGGLRAVLQKTYPKPAAVRPR